MSERMKTMNIYEISIRPHTQMIARAAIVAMILIGVAFIVWALIVKLRNGDVRKSKRVA